MNLQPVTPLSPFWQKFQDGLGVLRVLLALAGIGALVLELAFYTLLPPFFRHSALLVVMAVMAFEQIARATVTSRTRGHAFENLAILGATASVVAITVRLLGGTENLPLPLATILATAYVSATLILYFGQLFARDAVLALSSLVGISASLAVATLALRYGFREPVVPPANLHIIQTLVIAIFVFERFTRLLLAPGRGQFFRDNWIDFALMLLAAIGLAVSYRVYGSVVSLGALYIAVTQAYILFTLILRGAELNLQFAASGVHPTWLFVGSFAIAIIIGSGLLMLPVTIAPGHDAQPGQPIAYIDALFTAASATCVTGLSVKDIGLDFTRFGQVVVLGLIQVGGLGLMLFGTFFAVMVGKGISARHTGALEQALSSENAGELRETAIFIVAVTLAFEAIGAALLFPMFANMVGADGQPLGPSGAIWYSVFHSVSAFCNAGFSLYSPGLMFGAAAGLSEGMRYQWQIMGVFAPLIILGGLGFPVLQDCSRWVRTWLHRVWSRLRAAKGQLRVAPRPRLSLHSKLVISTSLALIVLGAIVLMVLEHQSAQVDGRRIGRHEINAVGAKSFNDWQQMTTGQRLWNATFQSLSARTAGFNTIDCGQMTDAGKMWMCGLMMVGGSPASTAGGMKTVTIAMLVLIAYSVLRLRTEVEVFGRSIAMQFVLKITTLAVLYVTMIVVVTLVLAVTMRGYPLIDLLFEACSACGTVGLTSGITAQLNIPGKLDLIFGMFIGRVGPLTLLIALTTRARRVDYSYPSESVLVG